MSEIETLVAAELAEAVDSSVTEMAAAIAVRHGSAARAMLFYGSCLRQRELKGLMLDFYLIVSDYDEAYDKAWLATANRLIPPNVFPFAHGDLAAKYAVLSEADFVALNRADARTVSVWARFAQPSRLVWVHSATARAHVIASIAQSGVTLFSLAAPIAPDQTPVAIWRAGFANTYRAELRAERTDRSASIVDADPDRYVRFGAAILAEHPEIRVGNRRLIERRWSHLRRNGKLITILRLAKASLTFSGGIDYLAWKINRHAGTHIAIKPWQRRWPLLGAIVLVPKLFAKGAVR